MQGTLTIIVLGILAFIGFCIYFIFKILEFVIRAINLYERIITREDVIIKLLIDIRDNTKSVDSDDWTDNEIDEYEDNEVDECEEERWDASVEEQIDLEDCEVAEQPEEEENFEQFAEYYDEIREKLMIELKMKLTSDQELTILNGMSGLSYNELKNMGTKPEDLSEVGLKVYQALMEKIEQYNILNQGNSTYRDRDTHR